ncbi:MAG: DUF2961 domain-containing protein [Candidatus Hydrogenedentes bacterium]|nr:DUF2961 domain-containing protein [Candidatus Hydrogenedentota bacterium]
MKRHVGFPLILLMVVMSGCAGLRPVQSSASGWTEPLCKAGITGCVESYAAPRDWRVHVVSNAPAAALTPDMTLADLKGPGCVLSLKSGNPTGTLSVSVDDGPAMLVRFANLFGGFLPPFTPPLAGTSATGGYSYVPISFAHHCVISVQGAEEPPVYQITYAEFPPETPIAPFSIELEGCDKGYFAEWARDFEAASKVRFVDRATEKYHGTSSKIWPHKDERLYALEGSGVITEIEMSIGAKDPDILRKVWIELYWDGSAEPAVVAPLAGFFGASSVSVPDYATPAFGKQGTRLWCRCPMPYTSGAQLRVVNRSDSKIDFSYSLTWRPGAATGSLYFHARYNESVIGNNLPLVSATVQGKGHYLGQRVAVQGAKGFHFVAANTTITADGAAMALAGNLAKDAYPGDAALTEARPDSGIVTSAGGAIGDAVPFQQSLTCGIAGPLPETAPDSVYSNVTMWYQSEPGGSPWSVPVLEEEPKK